MSNAQGGMSSLADGIRAALDAMNDAIYIMYLLGGAKYGATDEGFRRWLDEQKEWDDEPNDTDQANGR
jgi:hypothetical protein